MEQKDLKLLFDSGVLTKAHIVRAFMSDGYYLRFDRKGKLDPVFVTTRRGDDPRVFKTVEAVFEASKNIGFRSGGWDIG